MQKELVYMSDHIDFYFDIISPYAYIAHKKILSHKNIIFNYKPIFLGGLHNLAGIDAPAFNEYKMKNMINDCKLVSMKNNIDFKWNIKFPINSLSLMRGYLIVEDNLKQKYFEICFDSYWKDNVDISDEKNIFKILEKVEVDQEQFYKKIQEKETKDELKKLTDEAFNKDIFGAPTFVVNQKIFWGQDRLEYALDEYYS